MKKLLILFALVAGFAFSQEEPAADQNADSTDNSAEADGGSSHNGNVNETDMSMPQDFGRDVAQQRLQEISLDKFENPAMWRAYMPASYGTVSLRKLEGSPEAKKPIENENESSITEEDKGVIGLKVSFLKRGFTRITLKALRPMYVPGITKNISVWVVGRNYEHQLRLLIEDLDGRKYSLPMGKLNFSGWRKLTVTIPETVKQQNRYYNNTTGLKVLGFEIVPDMKSSVGEYYVYFDDLRATSDMFLEYARDPDDMVDNW